MYVKFRTETIDMARKTKEDAEQTRQAILDSALQTFYEKGFSRTTFDEIAHRINLTKGAVYWHFRNKTDLISAIIVQKITSQRKLYPQGMPSNIEELRQAVVCRANIIENDFDFKRFLFFMVYRMEWSSAVFDKVWSEVGELCELPDKRLNEVLQHLKDNGEIKENTNIPELSEVLTSFWKGLIDKYILGVKQEQNLSYMVSRGFDMIINGVRVEK